MLALRKTHLSILAALIFLLHLLYFYHKHNTQPIPVETQRTQLWKTLLPLLSRHAPDCPLPAQKGGPGVLRYDAINEIPRVNYLTNADEIQHPLQQAHDGFVRDIQYLKRAEAYVPGSKGIVSAAGGTYLPTFLVTLKLLRRTGTTLPVEIFLMDETEYEPHICDMVLPQLNAKCLVLSEIMRAALPEGENQKTISGFQLKAFAMLFSSFESFLWLDADCVPLHDTQSLLTSEPFISTGLVTWPDFFANTAAPIYFNISRQVDPPSTTRQATEAGAMLVNKKTHSQMLLLAAYYNYHGPDYYYSLLCQGAPGAGDKDTFLHAATALNLPFYAVSEPVVDLGIPTPWNKAAAVNAGYIQADPVQDFNLTSQDKYRVANASVADPPRAFFVHAGAPEFNPGNGLMGKKLTGFDGLPTRLWTWPEEAIRRLGFDAERMFWEVTRDVACDFEHVFESWRGLEGICEGVSKHWEDVFVMGRDWALDFGDGRG
ncbi:mannosyltransferase putative-domain-containing protein [Aspergillus unguis]